jgi:hypothetical protein
LDKRLGWEMRELDHAFDSMGPECKPLEIPIAEVYDAWDKLVTFSPTSIEGRSITSCRLAITALQHSKTARPGSKTVFF